MGIFDRFRKGSGGAGDSPDKESGGVLAGLKKALRRTHDLLKTDIRDLFKQEGRLVDDAFLDEMFRILVKTDMGGGPAGEMRDQLQSQLRGRKVEREEVVALLKAKFLEMLDQPDSPVQLAESGPTVILVVGVNGSGKTTSIAKLAHQFHREMGKSVVLGAGDTFRAAAVQQLTIWAERIGVDIVQGQQGGDPASVAHRTVAYALEHGTEVAIIDTAGRLQTQSNLMQELAKIRRVISKQIPEAPHEVLLVLDATAGQNGVSQAQGFSEAAGCTGIVLAKLDGTAKGGVIIPIRQKFGLPVKFIGEGEKETDISPFQPQAFVDALFE